MKDWLVFAVLAFFAIAGVLSGFFSLSLIFSEEISNRLFRGLDQSILLVVMLVLFVVSLSITHALGLRKVRRAEKLGKLEE